MLCIEGNSRVIESDFVPIMCEVDEGKSKSRVLRENGGGGKLEKKDPKRLSLKAEKVCI
jgi:hypothetical protein